MMQFWPSQWPFEELFRGIHLPKPRIIKEVLWIIVAMLVAMAFFVIIMGSFWDAECFAAILAMELALDKHWNQVWIECDSTLVVNAFANPDLVPWCLCRRWKNCLYTCKDIVFLFSHIFRERNTNANLLANHGVSSRTTFCWRDHTPQFVRGESTCNYVVLPSYKFSWLYLWILA